MLVTPGMLFSPDTSGKGICMLAQPGAHAITEGNDNRALSHMSYYRV